MRFGGEGSTESSDFLRFALRLFCRLVSAMSFLNRGRVAGPDG